MNGLFVVIEGIDGCGTTTQCRILARRVRSACPDRRVVVTAEPTGGPVGRLIRDVLAGRVGGASGFDSKALALLFASDRLDHCAGLIDPVLRDGGVVVSDRYVLSSMAYQGMDAPVEWVREINRFALVPDTTVFLKVPTHVAWSRIEKSREERDLFETPTTLERVGKAYDDACTLGPPGGVVVVDGDDDVDTVASRVWREVEPLL